MVSKTIAGREKDLVFLRGAARHRPVDRDTLLARLGGTALDEERRTLAASRLRGAFEKL